MIGEHYDLEQAARGLDEIPPEQALAILALSDYDRASFQHSMLRRLEESQEPDYLLEQPAPIRVTNGPTCWSKVIDDFEEWSSNDSTLRARYGDTFGQVVEDMYARDRVGRRRYGVPLRPNNGRNPLVDAYQELLDLAVYLAQALMEGHEHLEQVYGMVLGLLPVLRKSI